MPATRLDISTIQGWNELHCIIFKLLLQHHTLELHAFFKVRH